MNTVFLITKPSWRQAVKLKPTGFPLQMLQTISLNSLSEGNSMSASISIRGKRQYLREKAFKLNFWLETNSFHKLLVHWVRRVYNLLSAERFNYFTNMTEPPSKIFECLNITIVRCIATIHHCWKNKLHIICATLIEKVKSMRERTPPPLPQATPILTDMINMLLSCAMELASPGLLIQMSRCSRLEQGQPMIHIQMTVSNVEKERQGFCGWVKLIIIQKPVTQ